MSSAAASFFDGLAGRYDQSWTNSPIGRLQRDAVWKELDRIVKPGDRVLDLGCGTGEDAAHLAELGAAVDAIDASPKMVEAARRRGVNAHVMPIEQIRRLSGSYDLVLSNFGAVNCVQDLASLREPFARLLRPGGALAICLINRFCLWETAYYVARGQFKKAFRRWPGTSEASSGLRVFYPSVRSIQHALSPEFCLSRDRGIGIAVPPSYVTNLPNRMLRGFAWCDSRIAESVLGRNVADHRLLIFAR